MNTMTQSSSQEVKSDTRKASIDPNDLSWIKSQVHKPSKVVITGGMPYANGPLHLGHLAGALVPPDIYARFMRMLVGNENVLYVCGNDDHGSTSELSAHRAGKPIREFIDSIHEEQTRTLKRYSIEPNVFSGTSRPECYPLHQKFSQDLIRKLHQNKMLIKKTSKQWYDPELKRFLQDRLVTGKCPNSKCNNEAAYSDECEQCGTHYDPSELIQPKSTVSQGVPELRETVHWWLNLWEVSEELRVWIQGKEKKWRSSVYQEVIHTVMPTLSFSNQFETQYKELKEKLPTHKSKYTSGKKVAVIFNTKNDLEEGIKVFTQHGIETHMMKDWAERSISRDVAWGIPMPEDVDPEMKGKTLYVWPDSLVAPIAFTQVALQAQGKDPEEWKSYWTDPQAQIVQFLGQDNVYFYVLMQGAMWFGSQDEIHRTPKQGELQLSDVYSCFHLMVEGEKMSKSKGNFFSGDQLLDEKKYSADQIRYFLSMLTLPEKSSNFDFKTLDERNAFLAGPMNAAFEKPISACFSKYDGKVPQGTLNEKVKQETVKIIRLYLKNMPKADYGVLLNMIENYARQINSLFTQFKPHDDRAPEQERKDALYSCFYVLKNILIMLYPFVPETMEKLRESLKLPKSVYSIDELGVSMAIGHEIGEKQQYFPSVESR